MSKDQNNISLNSAPEKSIADVKSRIEKYSPFLNSLLIKEKDWLQTIWNMKSNEIISQLLTPFSENPDIELRRRKGRVALITALFDLLELWSLDEITKFLTDFADFATQTALFYHSQKFIKRLPEQQRDSETAGIFVIAMGKMGAFELNYSSDIDLIVLFDESFFKPEDAMQARSVAIKITQAVVKTLSETTEHGYVFRTDLRLRPNPSVTPVCYGASAALRYYEAEGRAWERVAMIKARVCAGEKSAGQEFLDALSPFVWRKNLDFNAIHETRDIMQKIRSHKGTGGEIKSQNHDLKLGRGGIREIEFFAQTQQIISGGRNVALRVPQTLAALKELSNLGSVSQDDCEFLSKHYKNLRMLEHRVQMQRDFQLHKLPDSDSALIDFAQFCGHKDEASFFKSLEDELTKSHQIVGAILEDEPLQESTVTPGWQIWLDQWQTYPAMRHPRSQEIFSRIQGQIFNAFSDSDADQNALVQFDQFLSRQPAGVQLFALFEANPKILELVIDICSTAPEFASYLAQKTEALSAVLQPDFFEELPNRDTYLNDLKRTLASHMDFEELLNSLRRWNREKKFQVGVLLLKNLISFQEAAVALTDIADAIIEHTLFVVKAEFSRQHGEIASSSICVLGMGKLGSHEMTLTSDLDLIVLYEAPLDLVSNGKKPLDVKNYFAKLTQKLITALSVQTSEGGLYEVDMRLRPSGRKGTVATSIESFEEYQSEKAWVWEHLALSRARVVAGESSFQSKLSQIRQTVFANRNNVSEVNQEIREMVDRLRQNKKISEDDWDLKSSPGAMMDIELLAQSFCVLGNGNETAAVGQLVEAHLSDLISKEDAEYLIETHKLCAELQHLQRLIARDKITSKSVPNASLLRFSSVVNGYSVADVDAALVPKLRKSAAIFERLLNRDLG